MALALLQQFGRHLTNVWIPTAIVAALPATSARAYELKRTAFSGGAVAATGSTFLLGTTVSEAGVVGHTSGASFRLGQGFWSNAGLKITDVLEPPDATIQWVNSLKPNSPNPFTRSTEIHYTVAAPSPVRIEIYDVVGRRVATVVDELQLAGRYQARWSGRDTSGRDVSSGVYFYRVQIGAWLETRKMLKLR